MVDPWDDDRFKQYNTQQSSDGVWWALYDPQDPSVVCLQWFDVWDYDEKKFLSPKRFAIEEEAHEALKFFQSVTVEQCAKMLRRLYHSNTDNISVQYKAGMCLATLGFDPTEYLFEDQPTEGQ